jgi:ferredoxin-NADP reductase
LRRIAGGGGGSREVHEALQPGSSVVVRGPRNAFPFIVADKYYFLAGGIGITPILPMIRDAARRSADWQFVYTGRSRTTMPLLDELGAFDQSRILIRPDDEYGGPDLSRIMDEAPLGAAAYCCGPPVMIDKLRQELPQRGIGSLHYERFSALPVVGGKPFEIELSRSGVVLTVAPDQTALAAVRAAFPDVAYSCQQGFCGTCRVRVLSGVVEHRDHALTEAERASQMLLCVSRADGRVAIDL